MVEKNAHAFEHQADLHCNATNKHFHTLEHICSICEFTLTDSNYSTGTEYQFIISVQQFLFHPFTESVNIPYAFQYLTARAPPVV